MLTNCKMLPLFLTICHILGSYHYQTNTVIKHFDWLTRMNKQHNKDNHTVIIKFNRDKLILPLQKKKYHYLIKLWSINPGLILFWLCVFEFKCFHNSIKPCSKHNNQTQFIVLAFCQSKEPWWLYCPTMCRRHITFEQVWLNSWWLPLCLASCWAPRWHNSIQHIYLYMTLVLIRIKRNRLEIQFFTQAWNLITFGLRLVPSTGFFI